MFSLVQAGMGDTSLNTPLLGLASASNNFGLRSAFSPTASDVVIGLHPTPLSTPTFPQHRALPKEFADNALGVYCHSSTSKVSPNLRLRHDIPCFTLFVPNNMHKPLGYISPTPYGLPPPVHPSHRRRIPIPPPQPFPHPHPFTPPSSCSTPAPVPEPLSSAQPPQSKPRTALLHPATPPTAVIPPRSNHPPTLSS